MGYDYTLIQIVCWVKLSEPRRLYLIFVKIWIPINGTHSVVSGHPKSIGISRVDKLSTGPSKIGVSQINDYLGARVEVSTSVFGY